MSQVAAKQLDLIVKLAGGLVVPRAMLPPEKATVFARLLQLAASAAGFVGSLIWPSMAIVGRQLAWGASGVVTLIPKLTVREFLREVIHGRPVIFVKRTDGDPYIAFASSLRFDASRQLSTFLNGNDWLAIAGNVGGRKVFTHVGRGKEGENALTRHELGLSMARAALMKTTLLPAIAEPILVHREREICFFTQTHLEGEKVTPKDLSSEDFMVRLTSAGDALVKIQEATFRQELPEQNLLKRFKTNISSLCLDSDFIKGVEQTIIDVEGWLEVRRPGSVQTHGDYTLSNVLFDKRGNLCAIIDWEWTRVSGCPGFDAVYLGISAGSERFDVDLPTFAANIVHSRDIPNPINLYFATIFSRLCLDAADLIPLTKLAWLYTIFRSAVWTSPTYEDWLIKSVEPMLRPLGACNEENAIK